MNVRHSFVLLACLALGATAAGAATLSGTLEDRGLRKKTQLVYIEKVPGKWPPASAPVVMNQHNNTYLPHLLPVLAGTTVIFTSLDPELHNVFARGGKKTLFNQAVLTNQKFQKVFAEAGLVVHLSCNIHKEMSADIVVLQNPFWVVPGE